MDKPRYKIHNTDSEMSLKPMLKEACKKHQVSEGVQAKLIADGVKLFSIFSDGSVVPTAGYKTVDDFVQQYRHEKPPQGSSGKTSKQALLEEMTRHSRAGNMSAYRECRKQYSECE